MVYKITLLLNSVSCSDLMVRALDSGLNGPGLSSWTRHFSLVDHLSSQMYMTECINGYW